VSKPVVDPDAPFLRFDQPCGSEPGHVMRDGRLTEVEAGGEVADADGCLSLPETEDHREPRGIGKRLEEASRFLRPDRIHRKGDLTALAPLPDGKLDRRHILSLALTSVDGFCRLLPSTFFD